MVIIGPVVDRLVTDRSFSNEFNHSVNWNVRRKAVVNMVIIGPVVDRLVTDQSFSNEFNHSVNWNIRDIILFYLNHNANFLWKEDACKYAIGIYFRSLQGTFVHVME